MTYKMLREGDIITENVEYNNWANTWRPISCADNKGIVGNIWTAKKYVPMRYRYKSMSISEDGLVSYIN